MAIKLTAQAQIMTFLHLMSVLNIWPRRPRENKVEILTCFYITERSNLEDSSSYGGSDSGYRGGSGGGGRRFGGNRFGGPRPFRQIGRASCRERVKMSGGTASVGEVKRMDGIVGW